MTDIPDAAYKLAPIFSLGTTDLEQRLQTAKDNKLLFAYVARQVTDAQAAEALGLGLDGIATMDEAKRVKPSGPLVGASVLGTTDIDNVGQSGLEKQFEAVLHGKNGKVIVEEGTKGRTIPGGVRTGVAATSGSTLVLSLDRVLQFEVEQLVAKAVDNAHASYGVAIVSRVGTSEILANSVVQRVDGNPAESTTENRAVTWGFEPGSIEKAITISALIDSGTVAPDSKFLVPSKLDVHDVTYTDDHFHPTEELTAEQIIQQSSNVGTIMMTQQLGESKLHQYLTNFGLGSPTGLGFPGEHSGYVGNYGHWDGTTLTSYAIGQSIIATPMQMLMALNTIANHGEYVAPRYVLGQQTTDGKFVPVPAPDTRQVISPESAAKVTQILESVITGGTGTNAALPGFTVAGKTGTAWEAQNPHWIDDAYRDAEGFRHMASSFMGFLPAENPQLSIMVVLVDVTNTDNSGGKIAAPVFANIADFATRLLNISPTTEATTSELRVRGKVEIPPPPSTLASATTIPASTIGPTTTANATTTTKAPTTTRPTGTSAPSTSRVPTTARAPTATPGR
jgi:cell division protein FtsI (penicillin-binding protein 3)